MTHIILDYLAVIGLIFLGLLAVAFRRRIFRPTERTTIRAAAWSLVRQSPPGKDKFSNESLQRSPNVSS